jgi:hypothetical protein
VSAFLLRQGLHYPGERAWTKAHRAWLVSQKLSSRLSEKQLNEAASATKDQVRFIVSARPRKSLKSPVSRE